VLSCTILSPLGLSNNTYSSVHFFSPFLTWNQSSRLPDPAATLVVGAALPLGESILLLGTASPVPNLFFLVCVIAAAAAPSARPPVAACPGVDSWPSLSILPSSSPSVAELAVRPSQRPPPSQICPLRRRRPPICCSSRPSPRRRRGRQLLVEAPLSAAASGPLLRPSAHPPPSRPHHRCQSSGQLL